MEFLGARGELTVQGIKIKLGKALSARIDRRFGDLVLQDRGIDKHQKGRVYALELAEDATVSSGPSADSPRETDLVSDSPAESAESADDDSEPRARVVAPCSGADGSIREEVGERSPHSPQAPRSSLATSQSTAESDAEDRAEGRCIRCGAPMSPVRISDRCGWCQKEDSRIAR